MSSILLLEDDPNLRRALAEALEVHGFRVVARSSVSAACRSLERDAPDVVVANLRLRGDESDLARALPEETPVIGIFDGHSATHLARDIKKSVQTVLTEPVTGSRLTKVIRATLEKKH